MEALSLAIRTGFIQLTSADAASVAALLNQFYTAVQSAQADAASATSGARVPGRPATGAAVRVFADQATQMLLVVAPAELYAGVEDWVKLLDRPAAEAPTMEVAVYPLARASAASVAAALTAAYADSTGARIGVNASGRGGAPEAAGSSAVGQSGGVTGGSSGSRGPAALYGAVTAMGDANTNTVVISAPAELLGEIDSLVKQLDVATPSSAAGSVTLYRMMNADPTALAAKLNELFGNTSSGRAGSSGSQQATAGRGAVTREEGPLLRMQAGPWGSRRLGFKVHKVCRVCRVAVVLAPSVHPAAHSQTWWVVTSGSSRILPQAPC